MTKTNQTRKPSGRNTSTFKTTVKYSRFLKVTPDAVNLVANLEATPEQRRDNGGPLGDKIGIDQKTADYISKLENPSRYGLDVVDVSRWWSDATHALTACSFAAVWQEGPKWPFMVELRPFTKDEGNMNVLLANSALEVQP